VAKEINETVIEKKQVGEIYIRCIHAQNDHIRYQDCFFRKENLCCFFLNENSINYFYS